MKCVLCDLFIILSCGCCELIKICRLVKICRAA